MAQAIDTFTGGVPTQNFLLFLFVIIFTFIFGSLLSLLVLKYLKERVKPAVSKTISKIVMYGIYALGLYLAFVKIINWNARASLAALGILGVAWLLPAVPLLQNIMAGFVLSLERPFNEEDIVEFNGVLCKVRNVMLRKTSLRAVDGRIIIVPNLTFITTTPIINYSKGEFIRVSLSISITADSDKEKAAEIIKKICTDSPSILPNIPEKKLSKVTKLLSIPANFFTIPKNIKNLNPRVMIKDVTKDKISLEVWFWIWDVLMKERIVSSFYKKLADEFKKEDIKFG